MTNADWYHFLYSVLGLVVGLAFMASGVLLLLRGVLDSRRRWHIKIGTFEVNSAAPGVAFAALGVLVIYFTRAL